MKIRVAGHPEAWLRVYDGISRCGHIEDGVAFSHGDEGGWVIDFADLERIYLACKGRRKPASAQPEQPGGGS